MNFTAESSHTLVAERGLYKLYNCGGSTVSLASVVALPRASTHPWHTGLLQGGGEEALAAHINLVQNHCRHLGKSLYCVEWITMLTAVSVPGLASLPALPPGVDNKCVHQSWAGEYQLHYEEPEGEESAGDTEDTADTAIRFTAGYHEDRRTDHLDTSGEDDWWWENEVDTAADRE